MPLFLASPQTSRFNENLLAWNIVVYHGTKEGAKPFKIITTTPAFSYTCVLIKTVKNGSPQSKRATEP